MKNIKPKGFKYRQSHYLQLLQSHKKQVGFTNMSSIVQKLNRKTIIYQKQSPFLRSIQVNPKKFKMKNKHRPKKANLNYNRKFSKLMAEKHGGSKIIEPPQQYRNSWEEGVAREIFESMRMLLSLEGEVWPSSLNDKTSSKKLLQKVLKM